MMSSLITDAPGDTTIDVVAPTSVNEDIVRRFYDGYINGVSTVALEDFVSVDFVDHVPVLFPNQPCHGPTALEWLINLAREAFPDLTVTVEELIVAGDSVVARVAWRGTHHGEVMGIAPTHRKIQITGLDLIRVKNGMFIEHWGQLDFISMLDQLNYLPSFDEPMG